ncbi:MAG: acyltransferase [Alteromonadales bacterium]|nr:acyltransferase [Alteromonadales bacterium]
MKRIHTLDSLKLLAICAIFVIHYGIFNYFQGIKLNSLYLSFNIVARFAVPVFFVIAGYLFFQRTQNKPIISYTKAYLVKILLMYLLWTFIYYAVFGLGMETWRPINLADALYYGTLGSEILWFLPALIYSIIALAVAVKFNKTGLLFIVASLLHIIGLSNQSYQPLLPESLQFADTSFRDPAFFGLFYVVLGYQLLKAKWIDKLLSISKSAPVWLTIAIITAVLMILEGLYLIQQVKGAIGEYYLFTPLLTVSMLMVALTIRSKNESSLFSKLGSHSGDIYLNHGVVQFFYGTILYFAGYYTVPEKMAALASNLTFQILVVPVMLVINFALYLLIRKTITFICNNEALKQYKDLVMFSGGYWIVFFIAGTTQGTPLFDSSSPSVLAVAMIIFVISYLVLARLIASSQQSVLTLKDIIVSMLLLTTIWAGFAMMGGFAWLSSHYLEEGSQVARNLSTPLLYFTIYFILTSTASIWLLAKIKLLSANKALTLVNSEV